MRGIETNLAFHRRCLRHPEFIAGEFDTGFIGRNAEALAPTADAHELEAAIIAVALAHGTVSPATASAAHVPHGALTNGHTAEISGWRRQLR